MSRTIKVMIAIAVVAMAHGASHLLRGQAGDLYSQALLPPAPTEFDAQGRPIHASLDPDPLETLQTPRSIELVKECDGLKTMASWATFLGWGAAAWICLSVVAPAEAARDSRLGEGGIQEGPAGDEGLE